MTGTCVATCPEDQYLTSSLLPKTEHQQFD